MTHKEATEMARKLKEFCNGKMNGCVRCPFVIKSVCETYCKIHYPCNWQIKEMDGKEKE